MLEQQRTRDAQNNPQHPDKDDVVKISVTLVQVDAVVTDKSGRQVTDLKPEDFEISEDGKTQRITNFAYVPVNQPAAATSVTATAAVTPAPVKPKEKVAIPPPPRLRPEQIRRTVALMVDDLSLSFTSVDSVRAALKKFVDEQMQQGDLVAIIRTSAGMGVLQQFTADKRQLYAAIDKVRWSPNGLAKVSAFDPIRASTAASPVAREAGDEERFEEERKKLEKFNDDADRYREDIFAIGTLGAINYVVRGLKDLPGRKSIVLFSDGLTVFAKGQNSSRILEAVRRLTDLANRSAVVIYTIDARGVVTPGSTAEDDFSDIDLNSEANMLKISEKLDARMQDVFDSRQGLEYLAYNTGGSFLRDANDLSRGMARVLEDQKGYYLIGYIPEETTFKTADGKRGYHKIKVKVKREGLTVRSRTGFFAVSEEEQKAVKRTPFQQMANALVSPFGYGEINLKLTSLFGYETQTGSFVSSLLHLNADKITFTQEADGWHKAVIDVAAVTLGDNGQLIDQGYKTYTLKAKDDLYKQILRHGFIYTLNLPVKKPGAYQLRVAVRDNASERIGSASQFVEVPDIGKGRLNLSGLIAVGYDAEAGSQAAANSEGVNPAISQAIPATRKFRQGSDVNVAFIVYNGQINNANPQPQLESQVFIYRDGKAIYTSEPGLIKVGQQADIKQVAAANHVKLGANMEPGEYVLQIVVTDKLAKEKYNTATQWIDFEVVK
jgi:VWFA-related protein